MSTFPVASHGFRGHSTQSRYGHQCGPAGKPCQAVLELSDDPYDSSPVSDERYHHVSLHQPRAIRAALPNRFDDEGPVALLLYRALLRMDAFEPRTALAILRESQDPRLRPLLASALMAAGHLDSAVSVLGSVSPGEFGDAARFWAVEQIAYSHILKGAISSAAKEYEALAASGHSAFQDIGIAGLIEIQLANGGIDAAMRTYQEALQSVEPGMMSARRIAAGLQNAGRLQEAIDVLARIAESKSAHDSERAWVLLQLQSLYQQRGSIEQATDTGWRLQELAPPGHSSGEVGLKNLIAMGAFGRTTSSTIPAFSHSYRKFLDANPGATDPARQIAYAAELRWEGKLDEAAAVYTEISRAPSARRKDRATALLNLQRFQLDSGQVERSIESGLAVKEVFPEDVGSCLASWQLMLAASAASGTPRSLSKLVEDFGRSLAREIRRLAQESTNAAPSRAQTLLLQFEKELNLQ